MQYNLIEHHQKDTKYIDEVSQLVDGSKLYEDYNNFNKEFLLH